MRAMLCLAFGLICLPAPSAAWAQDFSENGAFDIPGAPPTPVPPEPPADLQPDGGATAEEASGSTEPLETEGVGGLGQPMLNQDPFAGLLDYSQIPIEQYTVQPGDTLWDLSQRYLGNPWYWQQLWALNPQISNPHWIYPGDTVYFRPQAGLTPLEFGIGEERLRDEFEGADDEGRSSRVEGQIPISEISIMDKFNFFNYRRDGFIARSELKSTGVVAGSFAEGKNDLIEGDQVYIKAENVPLTDYGIGQTYEIFRNLGPVEHPITGDDVGFKITVIGQLKVTRIVNEVVVGEITSSFQDIQRGDQIRATHNAVKDLRPKRNQVSQQGYIVDQLIDNLVVGQMEVVFIDLGISQGVLEGNRLFVVRRGDGINEYEYFDKEELPYEKVAEILVLSTGSATSSAVVLNSIMGIKPGDRVVMEKNY